MPSIIFGSEAFSPKEIARRIRAVGVVKARLPLFPMLVLGVLAGAFIGIGGMLFVLVNADSALTFAPSALLGGVAFSLGLVIVIVAGAELFTGNNLLVMAWADRQITTVELLRNWAVVFTGNLIGAAGIAVLVCLAVWMATAGRTVVDKVAAIVFPITAFVAAGFEHSVANLYLFPMAGLIQTFRGGGGAVAVTWAGVLGNLVPVVLGNIVGGGVLVGLVYHLVYQRGAIRDMRE